jgi:recombination protein RecA
VDAGIITKSGSWFSYGTTRLAQGRDATKQLMIDNPELAEEIEQKIMAKISGNEFVPAVSDDKEGE